MGAVGRALRAALFLAIHAALALTLISAIHPVQLGLLAVGDPKLFDWMPVRYIFDAMDVGVLIAFFRFGGMEAHLIFKEHFRGAIVMTEDDK